LCNCRGKAADAIGASRHGAGGELVVGDGGAFDGAPDQIAVPAVGEVAAIKAGGPFPQGARQMLGADAVIGADEPGFDVAEQAMMIGKNSPALAPSPWTTGVCFKYPPRSTSRLR
jgi:hypothetical protein